MQMVCAFHIFHINLIILSIRRFLHQIKKIEMVTIFLHLVAVTYKIWSRDNIQICMSFLVEFFSTFSIKMFPSQINCYFSELRCWLTIEIWDNKFSKLCLCKEKKISTLLIGNKKVLLVWLVCLGWKKFTVDK